MKRLLFFMLLATQVAAAQFPVTQVTRTFQRIDEPLAEHIDSLMLDALSVARIPGGSVGVVMDGDIAYIAGYGHREVPFTCESVADGNTQFRTASICKPLTGLLVNLIAADYPEFTIDDEVEDWLPPSVLPMAAGTGVTVRQLMDHTAGMSNYGDGWDELAGYNLEAAYAGPWYDGVPLGFDPLYDAVKALDVVDVMSFNPGNYNYSTAHYMVLSAILQVVTGQRYTDLMQQYISEPLSMHRLEPEYAWKQYANITRQFESLGLGEVLPDPEPSYIHKLSAGGWLTSAADYAMFIQAVLNGQFPPDIRESVFGFNGTTSFNLSHTGGAPDYGYCSAVKLESWELDGVVWFANSRLPSLSDDPNDLEGPLFDQDPFFGNPSLASRLMDAVEPELLDYALPAFDPSERSEESVVVTGSPYDGVSESLYSYVDLGNADVVTVTDFDGFIAPSNGYGAASGDVRIVADDRVVLGPGTRIAEGGRLVAYIDNVADDVFGDGYACFTDAPTRSAEDEDVEAEATGLTLWPNPSDGRFRIDGLRDQDRLMVLDMVGRVILEQAVLDEGGMELDVSAQPPGIYFARVLSKDGTADMQRFVIR